MYLSITSSLCVALTAVNAFPASTVSRPLRFVNSSSDGFPNPSPAQVLAIEKQAGGSLPNGALPTSLKAAAITTLNLLANNELFEVAFFTQLLANITSNTAGYDDDDMGPHCSRAFAIKAISAILAAKEIHSIGANAILVSAGQPPIAPCQYSFPVTNFPSAILLAETFTDIALGTVPAVQVVFATDGGEEVGNVVLLGSILAQEGEQAGWFRALQSKTPSAAPFLTGGAADFAFTALQDFIVPGSCPTPLSSIPLTTFKPLTVVTKPEARNMTLEFQVPYDPAETLSKENNALVYLSGQNLPLTVPIVDPVQFGNLTVFSAAFPFEAGFANGLTIAAVVNGTGSFATDEAVAEATLYGPGLILVN